MLLLIDSLAADAGSSGSEFDVPHVTMGSFARWVLSLDVTMGSLERKNRAQLHWNHEDVRFSRVIDRALLVARVRRLPAPTLLYFGDKSLLFRHELKQPSMIRRCHQIGWEACVCAHPLHGGDGARDTQTLPCSHADRWPKLLADGTSLADPPLR